MTREEAIKQFEERLRVWDKLEANGDVRDYLEAIALAIEALRTCNQTCNKLATDCKSDTISRAAAIDAVLKETYADGAYGYTDAKTLVDALEALPPAQSNLSEEYAKAVRTWLVDYQIRCTKLQGRYTPYEVLGWIVSDWRKENEIW